MKKTRNLRSGSIKNITGFTSLSVTDAINANPSGICMALLSDNELYKKCQHYGGEALKWRWKFAGLLPEVNRRKLYEKKGFSSIFHFAKVLAGLSEDQVHQAMRLDKKFNAMPHLKRLFVQGAVSPNKLDRITSIANPENEEELAIKVKVLSKSAVETLVRDVKFEGEQAEVAKAGGAGVACSTNGTGGAGVACGTDGTNGTNATRDANASGALRNSNTTFSEFDRVLPGQEFDEKKLPLRHMRGTTATKDGLGELNLSPEIKQKLLELQQKGIDVNQLLAEFLKKREQEIEDEKFRLAQECHTTKTRYIPAEVRKILRKEHGIKCSIRTCAKQSEQIHHTQRFALSRNHDPNFLALLCKEHHEIASAIDTKTLERKWRI